jgi:hypothetical protein
MKKLFTILSLFVAFFLNAQSNIHVTSSGQLVPVTNTSAIISPEGGANFGKGRDIYGKLYNTTALSTTSGTIGSTSAVLGGVISPTNAISYNVGMVYSTDISFGTATSVTIQSNVAAGTYTSSISGLAPSTLYYAKAFVSNSAGTNYGNVVNFTTSTPTIVTTNLILHLDPANYSGPGATWNDLSTQNNTATLVGSPTVTSSPASFTFGSNKHATTTKSDISLTTATFIAWVNPSQDQGSYTGIIFNRTGHGGSSVFATGLDLYTNNSVGYHWNDNASTYNWNSGLNVTNNVWSMIAITVSANSATAYLCNINGISSAVNNISHSTLTGLNFFIACDPGDKANRAFTGKIGKAMIYNGALTLSEITSTFNALKSNYGL